MPQKGQDTVNEFKGWEFWLNVWGVAAIVGLACVATSVVRLILSILN